MCRSERSVNGAVQNLGARPASSCSHSSRTRGSGACTAEGAGPVGRQSGQRSSKNQRSGAFRLSHRDRINVISSSPREWSASKSFGSPDRRARGRTAGRGSQRPACVQRDRRFLPEPTQDRRGKSLSCARPRSGSESTYWPSPRSSRNPMVPLRT